MIVTDYLKADKNITWDYARQCGVKYATIRLPDDESKFDITDYTQWRTIADRFVDFGITPLVIEPIPNYLHDHIKIGDSKRDECIEKLISAFSIMDRLNIRTICFNFMAHIGWLRTSSDILERGGAKVTGFDISDFQADDFCITKERLWANYEYFIKAVVPEAEKYGVTLALHPDDPPVDQLGKTSRIMTNVLNIEKAMDIAKSDNIGLTFCQATFYLMGENLHDVIAKFANKIKFIHFRNVTGGKYMFRETCHDNGDLDMVDLLRTYVTHNIDVPIRVDHVPTMANERVKDKGYDALGRLFAIGYMRGIIGCVSKISEL